ncbi:OLC1v1002650C1 [Oldenlandia corymbosa var. corymbosa]|uniref:OLC1v1002650C1 n=1 Tax=Oldenlandia corymbosa var. corymbosa TaxID=529605 RepID=A0AAV1D8X0_OLDCO|nr:OLC1v1002650C1 [Oldenlandia corymbosa var. corymbosa]
MHHIRVQVGASISACDDNQNSGEAPMFTGSATGALTHSFIQIVERNEARLTYGYLISTMRNYIHDAQKALSNGRIEADSVQEPQLSSSEQFDVHSKKFVL